MTRTPWGDAAELRSRMLRPGPSAPPDVVARNQRERLLAATVAVVSEHGYEAARVADLVELSGVSRSAFYRHFEDKLDCYLATVDAIAAIAAAQIARAHADAGDWEARLRAAATAFAELMTDYPAAARLCLVEPYAAGEPALERLEAATTTVERAVRHALQESPERAGIPRDMVRGIVGGLLKTVQARLRQGEVEQLGETVAELLDWALGYRTPPEPLRRPRGAATRPEPPGADSEALDRLVDAVAATVADRGYPAATISEMASRAAISLSTFYAHFASKEDAFLTTLDRLHAQARGVTRSAYGAADGWERGTRDGIDALLGLLAAHPAATRLLTLEAYAAGPRAAERCDGLSRTLSELIESAPAATPRPAIAPEAIGGAIQALAHAQIGRGRVGRMRELTPTATFIALAPHVGADSACAMANASATRR